MGFPCGSAGKESACSVGDLGSITGLERSPGEGKGHSLQYSGLQNSLDYTVHGVALVGIFSPLHGFWLSVNFFCICVVPLGQEDPWRRAWQPTPVFLPGESHGQRSLGGYSPWCCKELDTTEQLHNLQHYVSSCYIA